MDAGDPAGDAAGEPAAGDTAGDPAGGESVPMGESAPRMAQSSLAALVRAGHGVGVGGSVYRGMLVHWAGAPGGRRPGDVAFWGPGTCGAASVVDGSRQVAATTAFLS